MREGRSRRRTAGGASCVHTDASNGCPHCLQKRASGSPTVPHSPQVGSGFGSAVLEALSNLGIATPVVRIGWPDQFIEHGKIDPLRHKYGITADAALEKLRPYLTKSVPAARGVIAGT